LTRRPIVAVVRQLEREADDVAIRYVQGRGCDPDGMPSFMKPLWNVARHCIVGR
jgi:predicted Zn-dependent protease